MGWLAWGVSCVPHHGAGMTISAGGVILSESPSIAELTKNRMTGQPQQKLIAPAILDISDHSAKHYVSDNAVVLFPSCDRGCDKCRIWLCSGSKRRRMFLDPYPLTIMGALETLRLTIATLATRIDEPDELAVRSGTPGKKAEH